jgi:hypothetical protein
MLAALPDAVELVVGVIRLKVHTRLPRPQQVAAGASQHCKMKLHMTYVHAI